MNGRFVVGTLAMSVAAALAVAGCTSGFSQEELDVAVAQQQAIDQSELDAARAE